VTPFLSTDDPKDKTDEDCNENQTHRQTRYKS